MRVFPLNKAELDAIQEISMELREIYILLENNYSDEIDIIDFIRGLKKVLELSEKNQELEKTITSLQTENNMLREILVEQAIEQYKKNKNS